MDLKTTYTFMPLPGISIDDRILRKQGTIWNQFSYPFNSFPPLECHISPPLAVINGGPKVFGLDLAEISSTYHGEESNAIIYQRLDLLNRIWGRITGAKDLAREWEKENKRKKRRQHQGDDTLQKSRRTTRSSAKSGQTSEPSCQAIGGKQPKRNGTRKRDRKTKSLGTTLSGDVLAQLGKHHNSADRIKEWVEDTARPRPK
jgi:hypothetical protein